MERFYKATRPDGTDFYSGTISYLPTGKLVRPKKTTWPTTRQICGPGYLHASDAPAETLIGGQWPCRLFVVEGKSYVSQGYKHGFKQLKVIEELPSHLALGPNGQEIVALFERITHLTSVEMKALDAAWWNAARNAAKYAAWDAAWKAARNAARKAAWNAAKYAAWDAAKYVARDAASALVVRDLISVEHFDTLYGPWVSVIGEDNG